MKRQCRKDQKKRTFFSPGDPGRRAVRLPRLPPLPGHPQRAVLQQLQEAVVQELRVGRVLGDGVGQQRRVLRRPSGDEAAAEVGEATDALLKETGNYEGCPQRTVGWLINQTPIKLESSNMTHFKGQAIES